MTEQPKRNLRKLFPTGKCLKSYCNAIVNEDSRGITYCFKHDPWKPSNKQKSISPDAVYLSDLVNRATK